MDHLLLCLTGSFRLRIDGRTVTAKEFPTRKAKQVLEVLALADGKPVSMDRLIDTLWGSRLPKNPVATLEQTVSVLRSFLLSLVPYPLIRTVDRGYALDRERVVTDVNAFADSVRSSKDAEPASALKILQEALELTDSTVLDDEQYADWAQYTRSRHGDAYRLACLAGANLALQLNEPSTTLALAERASTLALVPDERAARLMASALSLLGRRAEGLALLSSFERELRATVGVPLGAETLGLKETLKVDVSSRGLTLMVEGGSWIGTDLARFVGRENERAALHALIDAVRVGSSGAAVIAGSVGIGKSRLLSEFATECGDMHVVHLGCWPGTRHPLLAAVRLLELLRRDGEGDDGPPLVGTYAAAAELFQRLLPLLAANAPVVICIDDIHLADEASLAVFAALVAHRPPSAAIVMTASHTWLDREGGRRFGTELVLGPLGEAELQEWGVTGDIRETGGHPGVIAAVVASPARSGRLTGAVIDLLLARCDEAGPLARPVVARAAALKERRTFRNLGKALDVPESVLMETLRSLVRCHVLYLDEYAGFEFTDNLTLRLFLSYGSLGSPRSV